VTFSGLFDNLFLRLQQTNYSRFRFIKKAFSAEGVIKSG
jgi:hypothetical protein